MKASQTRIVKKKYLIGFVLVGTMFHYGITLYFVWIHKKSPFFENCVNNSETIEPEIQSFWGRYMILSAMAIITIITGSGLFCDIKMFLFIKRHNKTQPTQMVPWKSVNQKNVDDDKKVPLRATIISTTSLILPLMTRTLGKLFISSQVIDDYLFWIVPELLLLWGALNMPFMFMLTIKHKNKGPTVQSNQPPQRLQFHDETIEMGGISEPLQFHEEFVSDDVTEDWNNARTNQELEIVEVHQGSQNLGISHSGLNSTISIVGTMDQNKVPNPVEEYQNQQRCPNVQNSSNLDVPSDHEDPNEIVCVQRVTIISD